MGTPVNWHTVVCMISTPPGIPTEKSKLEEQGGMAAGDGASQMGQVGGAGNQQAHMPGPSLLGKNRSSL